MRPSEPRPYLFASRLLLCLIAVVLAITPLSEHLLDFDHFLRGGQDFELGLLALLATCCLVLLLAHLCREAMHQVVALVRSLLSPHPPPRSFRLADIQGVQRDSRPGTLPICFRAPLQI